MLYAIIMYHHSTALRFHSIFIVFPTDAEIPKTQLGLLSLNLHLILEMFQNCTLSLFLLTKVVCLVTKILQDSCPF